MHLANTLWVSILLCTASTVNADSIVIRTDYDSLCQLVNEAMSLESTPKARQSYINKNIAYKVISDDVKDAFQLILQVNPENRYSVFKNAVESSLGEHWECSALDLYFK
jgi:hypothetical protein